MIIITIPQVVALLVKTYTGVAAWRSDYELKLLERYYRISMTYQMYSIFLRMLLILLVSFNIWYFLLYILEFIVYFVITLRAIDRFI